MNHQFFAVLKDGAIFTVRSEDSFKDKTVDEIISIIKLEDSILCFKDKFSIRPLKGDEMPLKTHPQLLGPRQANILDVKCALVAKPLSFASMFTVFIKCKTQADDEIPDFAVSFDSTTYKTLTFAQVLEIVSQTFDLLHTSPSLFVDDAQADEDLTGEQLIGFAEQSRLLFSCVLEEKSLSRIKMRKHVVAEIVSSEQSYIGDLNALLNYFKPQLEKYKLLTEEEKQLFFRDIGSILSTHAHFFMSVSQRGLGYSAVVSDCLIEFSQFFKLSMNYIGNYNKIAQIASKFPQATMDDIVMHCPTNKGRNLSSYLITPVQRIPRYVLFIRELIKMTPQCHPDAEALNAAYQKIDAVTRDMQEQNDRNEAMTAILDLQNRLTTPVTLIAPNRTLLFSSPITFPDAVLKEGFIYIFTDILLVTQKLKKDDKEKPLTNLPHLRVTFDPSPSDTRIQFTSLDLVQLIEFANQPIKTQFLKKFAEGRALFLSKIEPKDKFIIWEDLIFDSYPPAAIQHDGVIVGDEMYFLGGFSPKHKVTQPMAFLKFSPSVMKFNYSDDFSIPVVGASLSAIGNTLYLFGGVLRETQKPTKLTFYCQIGATAWTQLECTKENHVSSRAYHSAVSYKNQIFVFGGVAVKGNCLNDVYCLNIASSEWRLIETTGDVPSPRKCHSVTLVDQYMIMHGGRNHKSDLNDIWALNLDTYAWTELEIKNQTCPKFFPRSSHKSFTIGHCLFVIGGTGPVNPLPSFVYDLKTGMTEKLENIGNSLSLRDFSALVYNNDTYVYGGSDNINGFTTGVILKVIVPPRFLTETYNTPADIPALMKSSSPPSTANPHVVANAPPSVANTRIATAPIPSHAASLAEIPQQPQCTPSQQHRVDSPPKQAEVIPHEVSQGNEINNELQALFAARKNKAATIQKHIQHDTPNEPAPIKPTLRKNPESQRPTEAPFVQLKPVLRKVAEEQHSNEAPKIQTKASPTIEPRKNSLTTHHSPKETPVTAHHVVEEHSAPVNTPVVAHEAPKTASKATPQSPTSNDAVDELFRVYDQNIFANSLGIDITKLVAFQTRVISPKLKKLWCVLKENNDIMLHLSSLSATEKKESSTTQAMNVLIVDQSKKTSKVIVIPEGSTENAIIEEAKKINPSKKPQIKFGGKYVSLTSSSFQKVISKGQHIKIVL